MPTETECSSSQLSAVKASNFCEKTFCPAANAAWPHELPEICRPLVGTEAYGPQVFGEVRHAGDVPAEVKSFCEAHKQSIIDESQSHVSPTDRPGQTSGCLFSVLYDHMLDECRPKGCLKKSWACLVPQSYCTRVGNEADSISSTLKYRGDSGGLVDTSGIERYDNEHSCNVFCLASATGGLPPISAGESPRPSPSPQLS
jgi:hypothetical protein